MPNGKRPTPESRRETPPGVHPVDGLTQGAQDA